MYRSVMRLRVCVHRYACVRVQACARCVCACCCMFVCLQACVGMCKGKDCMKRRKPWVLERCIADEKQCCAQRQWKVKERSRKQCRYVQREEEASVIQDAMANWKQMRKSVWTKGTSFASVMITSLTDRTCTLVACCGCLFFSRVNLLMKAGPHQTVFVCMYLQRFWIKKITKAKCFFESSQE